VLRVEQPAFIEPELQLAEVPVGDEPAVTRDTSPNEEADCADFADFADFADARLPHLAPPSFASE
jgi:hypothetical protein